MSEIVWINHAGYELRVGDLRIVHDPWLFGRAFGEGWDLISESRYKPKDFAGVDYIWFSHEHPDHFSPAVLKQIPEEIRRTITVLFQETRDKRVVRFCKKLGFAVQELRAQMRVMLKDGVAVTCGTVLGGDSWLFTETPDSTIFNANDCVGVDWKAISASLPRPVDVLLTQFSYANWVGNPGDDQRMKHAASQKLGEMRSQLAAFLPRTLVPFASYVWFCRNDNFYMNEHVNSIATIADAFDGAVDVVVLYPGDVHVIGSQGNNASSVARYETDRASHDVPHTFEDARVELIDLMDLAVAEQQRLHQVNHMWYLKPLVWGGFIKPVTLYLKDLGVGIRYSMFGGILADGFSSDCCEFECSSGSFAAMLKNGYGYSTLAINGRFRELVSDSSLKVSRHFAIAARNEEGDSVPGVFLRTDYVRSQVRRALSRVI